MTKQEEIDENIELYFYNPSKTKDDFINDYKKIKIERYKRESGYRYSPLFFILKDIRFCFGARKQFNYIPKKEIDPANFAGVILIYTAFNNLVKEFYGGNYPGFAKNFMNITSPMEVKALNYLRNALIHKNYGLYCYIGDKKYYFFLGVGLDKLIEEVKMNTSYSSVGYKIDVRKLMNSFEKGVEKYKEYLLNHNNKKARKKFCEIFNVTNWIYIKE
jgi:hypothetical protein